jgi:hypothetical protein
MNESAPRVNSHTFGSEGRHHCRSERRRVSIRSNVELVSFEQTNYI